MQCLTYVTRKPSLTKLILVKLRFFVNFLLFAHPVKTPFNNLYMSSVLGTFQGFEKLAMVVVCEVACSANAI